MRWIIIVPFLPYSGMAVFPFIFLKRKEDRKNGTLINHERIHHRQQTELFILPFYAMYFINYLFNLIRFRKHHKAYREIVFEKEAYANEKNASYLLKRKFWNFIAYL